MFYNYVRVAFRNLIKYKLYSAINIIGLAIGLAASIIILVLVNYELSYDKHWANADKLYRLHTAFEAPGMQPFSTITAQAPSKHALKDFFSEEIEYTTRFTEMGQILRYGGKVFYEVIIWTDPETVDMFDFKVIAGDLRATLNDNASLAIDESFARKHFGDENPLGKVVTFNTWGLERDYKVGAVYEDLPHNTVLALRAFVMIDEKDFTEFPFLFESWSDATSMVFMQLKDGVSIEAINSRLAEFTNTHVPMPPHADDLSVSYSTQALPDIYLNPQGPPGSDMKPAGNMEDIFLFSTIAGLILLIACINFVNLATARSTKRAREVGLRKALGARRGQLVLQFLGESILISLIGLGIGMVLVEVFLPVFSDFVGKELVFDYMESQTLLIFCGLVITVGVLGGVYPALILSGFLPAHVLKATTLAETSKSVTLRNAFVVLQFSISIILIIATGVVYGQQLYATNLDPGFTKDNQLLVRNVSFENAHEKRQILKQEIARLPNVLSVALHEFGPVSGHERTLPIKLSGTGHVRPIPVSAQTVDHDFFETYQIPIIAGRGYNRELTTDGMRDVESLEAGQTVTGTIIVNKGALQLFGYGAPEEAIGKNLNIDANEGRSVSLTIIGVVPDVHYHSIRSVIRPELYVLNEHDTVFEHVTIRFSGDGVELAAQVEQIWRTLIPEVPFRYGYVDEMMAQEFNQEVSLAAMLATFSILAVAIACLGLYGLASFTAERRTKEIGIRKVMGASVMDIVRLLLWQFSKPVLIANLIAWPLAVWGMMSWLENFPYRLEAWIMVPLCLVAGVIALGIAWATVGGNAAKVARSNPIKALRYE